MTSTASIPDSAYAAYMLQWVEKLDFPHTPIAVQTLPQLAAFWRASEPADLDAISDQLWAWVDQNGGPPPSSDHAMICVRMLICLATASNQELQTTGYFEDLLARYGVGAEQIKQDLPFDKVRRSASEGEPAPAATAPVEALYAIRKAQILMTFAAVSFLSGANPMIEMAAETARSIELGLLFLMVFLIFQWYRIDAEEHHYPRTMFLNFSIVLVAAVAVPYYLLRSRGWQRGQLSLMKAIAVFLGSIVLSAFGASLFGHVP